MDLVPDCSSAACIRGLKRFFSRRGVPPCILSDNGSQFASSETQNFASCRKIAWKFNVPGAPWWGGMFERLIRSTKRCLKKVLFKSYLTYEQLLTVLLQIEVIINNRPLTFIYEKPGDEPLTPNHLLLGRKLNLEAINETEINENLNARNNYIVTVLVHYWQ